MLIRTNTTVPELPTRCWRITRSTDWSYAATTCVAPWPFQLVENIFTLFFFSELLIRLHAFRQPWHALDHCRPLLDNSAYSRLEPDKEKGDREVPVQIDLVGVLYCRQAVSYSVYQRLLAEEEEGEEDGGRDKEEVTEYAGLVGNAIAKRMLLYRSA